MGRFLLREQGNAECLRDREDSRSCWRDGDGGELRFGSCCLLFSRASSWSYTLTDNAVMDVCTTLLTEAGVLCDGPALDPLSNTSSTQV